MFPGAVDKPDVHIIALDHTTGLPTVLPGLALPTHPFFGIVGVAPPAGWGCISSTAPRCQGGNMDNKELVAATMAFLPVWVDGAIFSAADGHAAQGDGEVDLTAIETCLEGEVVLTVWNDLELPLPIAVRPSH
jgi:acetamidase/formamidase